MKSWKKPTPEQVDQAIARLSLFEHRRYFFDRLENPEWVIPLKSKGFFSHPPAPQSDTERNVTTFFVWPESRYLARMASFQPDTVFQIIFELPETDNPLVLLDLVQATLNMPTVYAVRLVGKAKRWAQVSYQDQLPEKLGKLIVHLAAGGEVQSALDLAATVFEVLPDPQKRMPVFPKPKTRFSIARYKKTLRNVLPHLVKASGIKTFTFFCDLLGAAVSYSRRHGEVQGPEDYSYIWRPVIQSKGGRLSDDLRDILIMAVLEAGVQVVQSDSSKLSDLVRLLDYRPWRVFHRIALFLLKEFWKAAPELVAEHLTTRSLFNICLPLKRGRFVGCACLGRSVS